MNPANSKDAFDLAKAVTLGVREINADVVLCPPFVYVTDLLPSKNVSIGAQDCFWEDPPVGGGAFTGEVSARMLKNLGCSHVILGHSERRKYAGETLYMVAQKVKAALIAKLIPVICIGQDIELELPIILKGISKADMAYVVLTFEPEWAISTSAHSKPATPEEVRESIGKMRKILAKLCDERTASRATILYGGTVNSKDIQGYAEDGFVQGFLVGASSLDAAEFIVLVEKAAA